MKCSKCGREFGDGAICQYCGIDRVTGLGNFSGYNSPSGSYEPHYSSSNNGGYASNTMVCYACSEIIPKNSIYCPACGRQLWVECPNCGSVYSSQYKICSKCGTNRDVYYKQKEAEKQRAIKEEQERQRKQREWEQAENARKKEEPKKQEEEKNVDIIIFFIFSPIWGIFWYAGVNEMLPKWGVQIPEFWPKTLSAEIIVCLILGMLTHYILWIIDRNK